MSQDCVDSAVVGNPEEFPCYFPRKRHMCREEDRMETFRNSWCDQKRPTAQEMVNAGFCYKKYGDRVCCFYCGGRLFQWKAYDNPWYEHAKWFPLCEYVLKKRGVEYVRNVCSKHLDLKRPQIKNPTLSTAANQIRSMLFVEAKQNLDEMMMFDHHVKFAKSIGVKDTKIRHALMQQLEKHNRNFENRQELLNAIMDLNQEDKCMKCKSNEKNAVGMPCGHMIYYESNVPPAQLQKTPLSRKGILAAVPIC